MSWFFECVNVERQLVKNVIRAAISQLREKQEERLPWMILSVLV